MSPHIIDRMALGVISLARDAEETSVQIKITENEKAQNAKRARARIIKMRHILAEIHQEQQENQFIRPIL